ncbi:MAG: CbiQ family ECF transporter T component [Ruminococcus sp.]
MSEKLLVKNPVYPIIGLLSSGLIIVFGLITAKNTACIFFLGAMWLLFLLFGYWRSCFAVVPVAAVLCAVFAGITYAVSGDAQATLSAVNRILAVCIAVIPGLALSPIILVRNFSTLKLPRMFTLAMMITLTFFPLLGAEVRQVREAMKTRGAGSLLSPKIFYRAFLIPLVMRLVNISDILALSVETRGFSNNADECSVYKTVSIRVVDIIFLLLVMTGAILAVIL